jgi:AraC-like DNA-binding protein/mannose-6-phosphate isomerase-like protein (cupin superfamily)
MTGVLLQSFPMLPGRRAQAWRHQESHLRPRHFHDEPEINLVLHGSALLGVGYRTERLRPGEAICFAPGQDHVLLEASSDLQLFVFALKPELAERVLPSQAAANARFTLHGFTDSEALLSGLSEVNDPVAYETQLSELFRQITTGRSVLHTTSRRALNDLSGDPAVSQASLARSLRTLPSELSRHFHHDVGVRLVEYRARLRLMRFVRAVDGGLGFTRAALSADFGSYAQCHRVFRRVLGCSPTAYFRGNRELLDSKTMGARNSAKPAS